MKSGGSGLNDSHDGYGVRHGADVDGFMITMMIIAPKPQTRISNDTGRDAPLQATQRMLSPGSKVKTEHYVYEKTCEDVAEDP